MSVEFVDEGDTTLLTMVLDLDQQGRKTVTFLPSPAEVAALPLALVLRAIEDVSRRVVPTDATGFPLTAPEAQTTQRLSELSKTVISQQDLAAFVDVLKEDYEKHPDNWRNPTLATYLNAAAVWAKAMDRFFSQSGETSESINSFRLVAEALLAARSWE